MKVVFLGTPIFAKIVMEYVIKSKHKIVALICQPDNENAKGNKTVEQESKKFAIENNIPVYQFNNINHNVETVISLGGDILVTAAYGQLLKKDILECAKNGVINVHGSLLPYYRGASPVQYAILNGDSQTGVTIMKTEIGMDDGDIILQDNLQIEANDNSETLMVKMAHLGGKLLVKALDLIEEGKAIYTHQNHEVATFTKMLKKEKSYLDFNDSAKNCFNKIRAYNPSPVARLIVNNDEYKIYNASYDDSIINGENGEIIECNGKTGIKIKCSDGILTILEIQAPNGKRMSAKSFANGNKLKKGDICKVC